MPSGFPAQLNVPVVDEDVVVVVVVGARVVVVVVVVGARVVDVVVVVGARVVDVVVDVVGGRVVLEETVADPMVENEQDEVKLIPVAAVMKGQLADWSHSTLHVITPDVLFSTGLPLYKDVMALP